METNPYSVSVVDSVSEEPERESTGPFAARDRPSPWRHVVAACATIVFLYLGYFFLVSMRGRQWIEATTYLVGSLSATPWVLHDSKARHCLAGSVVIAVGTLCAAASQVCYFAMFEFEWFNDIFNGKGAGEFGMLLFGGIAFAGSGYVGWRLLALVGLTSEPLQLLRNHAGCGER
ncbi:MAG: hypothetical protein AAFU85_20960 [Planctomycetota bacterium]